MGSGRLCDGERLYPERPCLETASAAGRGRRPYRPRHEGTHLRPQTHGAGGPASAGPHDRAHRGRGRTCRPGNLGSDCRGRRRHSPADALSVARSGGVLLRQAAPRRRPEGRLWTPARSQSGHRRRRPLGRRPDRRRRAVGRSDKVRRPGLEAGETGSPGPGRHRARYSGVQRQAETDGGRLVA